jgi:hypothetical protein
VLEITKEKPLKSSSQTVGCGWSGGGSGRAEHGHSPGTILQKRLQLGRASRPLARQPNCLKTKMPAPPQSATLNCHPQPQQRRPVAPHAVGKLPRAAIRILHMEWNNQPKYAGSSRRVVRAGRCHSAQHDGNVARLCCAQARVYESGATWQRHPHNRNPLPLCTAAKYPHDIHQPKCPEANSGTTAYCRECIGIATNPPRSQPGRWHAQIVGVQQERRTRKAVNNTNAYRVFADGSEVTRCGSASCSRCVQPPTPSEPPVRD